MPKSWFIKITALFMAAVIFIQGGAYNTSAANEVDISGAVVTVSNQTYSALSLTPLPQVSLNGKVLKNNRDYELSYSDNINVGTGYITVSGKGAYTGTAIAMFSIYPAQLKEADISISGSFSPAGSQIIVNARYNGKPLSVDDYTFSEPGEPAGAGKQKIKLTGSGNFTGSVTVTGIFNPEEIGNTVIQPVYSEDGEVFGVTVSLGDYLLVEDKDYKAEIAIDKGIARVKVTGLNNFSGNVTEKYDIRTVYLNRFAKISEIKPVTYNGTAHLPSPEISIDGKKLKKNKDYTLTYQDNVNVGTATIAITGINDYLGLDTTAQFEILPIDISGCSADIPNQDYTGDEIKPIPSISCNSTPLIKDKDFTILSYRGNTNAGTGYVKVKGIGNYGGECEIPFTIVKLSSEESAVRTRLDEMMAGKWDRKINAYTHSYKVGNYFNTLLTSPCQCHSFCSTGYESGCTCLIGRSTVLNNSGIQCCGFAVEVFEYLFGSTNKAGGNTLRTYSRAENSWTEKDLKSWFASFKVGDYLAYDNITYGYPHYVIIYKVDNDGLWVYEANYGGRCKINFRKMTYQEIYNQLDGLYHRTPVNYCIK